MKKTNTRTATAIVCIVPFLSVVIASVSPLLLFWTLVACLGTLAFSPLALDALRTIEKLEPELNRKEPHEEVTKNPNSIHTTKRGREVTIPART